MRDVTVKAAGPDAPITSLSGGNQQKVVLGKALLTEPRVLLLDEPTRGIDVGAKADIFELMTEQARRGLGVLFATSELEEALHVPDRLLVMSKGRVVREFRRGDRDARGDHGGLGGDRERSGEDAMSTSVATHARLPTRRRRRRGRRLKAFNLLLELRAFIALIVLIVVFALLSDAYLTVGQPRHDDQARRDQRDPGHRDADGHPHRRHRPLGRLDRRASPGSSPACCSRA